MYTFCTFIRHHTYTFIRACSIHLYKCISSYTYPFTHPCVNTSIHSYNLVRYYRLHFTIFQHMHTYMYTCIHVWIHACIHTIRHLYLYPSRHACIHTVIPLYIYICIHPYRYTFTFITCLYPNAPVQWYMFTSIHLHYAHMHVYSLTLLHVCTCTHVHAYSGARMLSYVRRHYSICLFIHGNIHAFVTAFLYLFSYTHLCVDLSRYIYNCLCAYIHLHIYRFTIYSPSLNIVPAGRAWGPSRRLRSLRRVFSSLCRRAAGGRLVVAIALIVAVSEWVAASSLKWAAGCAVLEGIGGTAGLGLLV